jgi:hypothetical protein
MSVFARQLAASNPCPPVSLHEEIKMTANIGNAERMTRFIAGALLLALGLFAPLHPYIQIALIAAGVIAVITAAVRFCPIWAVLGINTCGR